MKSLDGSADSIIHLAQIPPSNQIHDLQGSSELGESRGHRKKQLASGQSATNLTKRKRKQLVNATMDNDGVSLTKMPKNWESTRFERTDVLQKAKLPKWTPEEAGDTTEESLLEAHDPDGCKALTHCQG